MDSFTYIVKRIDGDYAHLQRTDKPEDEILVAMALLPEETDEGITLLWSNLSYTVADLSR